MPTERIGAICGQPHIPSACALEAKRRRGPGVQNAASDGQGQTESPLDDRWQHRALTPNLHQTKVHICGPFSDAANELMQQLDMNVTVMDGEVGHASSTKMVRSIIMKGFEATVVECVLAGRMAGVDELVLDSLDKTYPGFNFREKAAYMLERVMVHGVRRAAELREVAITVDQLGLDNSMSSATVNWQQLIGEMKLDPNYDLAKDDYKSRADIVLAALGKSPKQ